MDQGNTTTRKGFMRRAGLAIAGVFALSKGAQAASGKESPASPSPFLRIKPAKGAVQRKV